MLFYKSDFKRSDFLDSHVPEKNSLINSENQIVVTDTSQTSPDGLHNEEGVEMINS